MGGGPPRGTSARTNGLPGYTTLWRRFGSIPAAVDLRQSKETSGRAAAGPGRVLDGSESSRISRSFLSSFGDLSELRRPVQVVRSRCQIRGRRPGQWSTAGASGRRCVRPIYRDRSNFLRKSNSESTHSLLALSISESPSTLRMDGISTPDRSDQGSRRTTGRVRTRSANGRRPPRRSSATPQVRASRRPP